MRSPLASAFFIESNTVSTAVSAFVLVTPVLVDDFVDDVQLDHAAAPDTMVSLGLRRAHSC